MVYIYLKIDLFIIDLSIINLAECVWFNVVG